MFDPSPSLTDLFGEADLKRWREKAGADLKGKSLDELATFTGDGLDLQPLYTEDGAPVLPAGLPGQPLFVRGGQAIAALAHGPDVRTQIDAPAVNAAAAQIREDLERGATSIWLQCAVRTEHGWTPGVRGVDARALAILLEGIDPTAASVHLTPGAGFESVAGAFLSLLEDSVYEATAVRGGLGADPLGSLARDGELPTSAEDALAAAARLAKRCVEGWPQLRAAQVDADFVHHAGATTAQQLGTALAVGLQWIRAAEAGGLTLEQAFAQVEFTLRLDARFFEQIAALRAFRHAWGEVATACGVEEPSIRLHVAASDRVLTRRDPWVNLLRGTAVSFAALVGGADSVSAPSFDQLLGPSAPLGRRLARNTPIILAEESHLDRVMDPAGGSWFLEDLSARLAERAWDFFSSIEREGGALAVIRSHWLRDQVDAAWAARESKLRTRRIAVTGVSEFPNLDETRVGFEPDVEDQEATKAVPTPRERIEPWPVRHDADPFETLRDASDEHLKETGARPRVFLATLGPVAAHTTRATWIANLLNAGGIEAISPGVLDDAEAAATAFAGSGANAAVICSTDGLYAEFGVQTARALVGQGAKTVLLAGRGGDLEPELREAGVERFLFLGSDVVEELTELLRQQGVLS